MFKHKLAPIKQVEIKPKMTVSGLIKEFKLSGVMQAGKLAQAVDICEEMIQDKDCKVFLGQAGAMVPGGMKNILVDMLKNRYMDVFVTTGATLTHDLAEAFGFQHLQGHEKMDDAKLHKKQLDRMYNSLMSNKVYGAIEDFISKNFSVLSRQKTVKDFLWKIGELLNTKHSKNSILKICYENRIPIFCPAISDSGLGLMVWGQIAQNKTIDVNAFEDLKEILDIAWTAKRTGVIYIGGGTPKNYIQQAMQFSRQANYGVQITTDNEAFGGSSGAPLREGISWGKLSPKARFVDVNCDATIALPILYAALKDRFNLLTLDDAKLAMKHAKKVL